MSQREVEDGVDGFMADLKRQGLEPTMRQGVIVYQLVPATGVLAGQEVSTGVGVDELQGWPAVPPHWIHLPDDVHFDSTNMDLQTLIPGWGRHSRDIGLWDMSRRPILNWLSHVRGVIGQAVA